MSTTGLPAAATRLLQGPVGSAGGVVVIDGLPDQRLLGALLEEAMAGYLSADRQDVIDDDNAAGRGGTPARHVYTAGGGSVQNAFYAAPWLSNYLSSMCGAAITPSGSRGSYSYYVHDGDYLGLHLDIETCDVTLVSVLRDDAGQQDSSGGLLVHTRHLGSELHAVRRAPQEGLGLVKATTGQSIVLLGGLLPHETVPISPGRTRVTPHSASPRRRRPLQVEMAIQRSRLPSGVNRPSAGCRVGWQATAGMRLCPPSLVGGCGAERNRSVSLPSRPTDIPASILVSPAQSGKGRRQQDSPNNTISLSTPATVRRATHYPSAGGTSTSNIWIRDQHFHGWQGF